MKPSATVYVFDVDGVLCELGSFAIDRRVMSLIAQLLDRGEYCAINTGRSYDRVGAEFIEPFKYLLPNASLEKLIVSTEMGGEVTHFIQRQPQTVNTNFAMSDDELKVFYDVWEAHRSELSAMYVYKAKKTMATTVHNHDYEKSMYYPQKAKFEQLLRDAFAGTGVIVTGTSESTDVHAAHAGKNAGTSNIIGWLARVSDTKHDIAVCFGDSHNDYEMAREFAANGFDTTFVYTGVGLEVARPHDAVKVVDTSSSYADGTVEYLRMTLSA